jgi:uncharacterized membrane protein YgcG
MSPPRKKVTSSLSLKSAAHTLCCVCLQKSRTIKRSSTLYTPESANASVVAKAIRYQVKKLVQRWLVERELEGEGVRQQFRVLTFPKASPPLARRATPPVAAMASSSSRGIRWMPKPEGRGGGGGGAGGRGGRGGDDGGGGELAPKLLQQKKRNYDIPERRQSFAPWWF